FTGAAKGGKKGLFEEASGGTIFLDEIGEIDFPLQSKLLRTLQEKELVRVGGTRPVAVDVRVIAATNANLEEKVRARTFREDLYYRLNVIPIQIPPLRDRKEDLAELAEHIVLKLNREFGRRVQGISDECMKSIVDYDWPGNVRELENVLGRAMISMRPQDTVMAREHLPPLPFDTMRKAESPPEGSVPLARALAVAETVAIRRALDVTEGNRSKAAVLLGISLRSLYYKMSRHGIMD
ncbi:MAG: sigma 54-interacting transcriptional regulator, partial [Thermodesulfovibrionales bacterium]